MLTWLRRPPPMIDSLLIPRIFSPRSIEDSPVRRGSGVDRVAVMESEVVVIGVEALALGLSPRSAPATRGLSAARARCVGAALDASHSSRAEEATNKVQSPRHGRHRALERR